MSRKPYSHDAVTGRAFLASGVVVAVLLAGSVVLAGPAAAVPPGGMTAAQAAAMFAGYGDAGGHWTGGDSTASVLLPDGRVAWLFSDTFLGTVNPDGSRPANTPMVNNTIVVQDGGTNLVSTLHGGTAAAPEALVKPSQAGEFFWVADGMVEGGALKVLYNRYRRFGPGGLDVELTGTSLATFTLPGLALGSVVDLPLGRAIAWGSSLVTAGSYTYVYGSSSGLAGLKFGHVARVPAGNLGGAWQFWTGSAWSADPAVAGRLLSGVGTAYAVRKIGTQYVLVTQENNAIFDPQIVAYTATAPTGPFTGPIQLFTAPEPQPGSQKIVYHARLHQELARSGKLLVSYDVNSLNNQDNYADARLYRPRFVEVDWPRPTPGGLPAAPTGLTVSFDAAGVVYLAWNAVSGASSYRVHRKDVTGGQTHFVRQVAGVTQPSADVSGLVPGHRYEFKVTAVNANGEGPFSTVVTTMPRIARDDSVINLANTPEAVPGQYIVEFKDAPAVRAAGVPAFAQELVAQAGGTLGHVYTGALVGFSAGMTENQAIDLVGHPDVLGVEQDQTVSPAGVQIDPPWGLDRIDQRNPPPPGGSYTYPNQGDVHVYVIDTGVRIQHNTFQGRAVHGWNAVDNNANADDCADPAVWFRGHGTRVASILGGSDYGVPAENYGVAKGAQIVAVKVFPCSLATSVQHIIKGVDWVTNNAQRPAVVNMSLAAPKGTRLDKAVKGAVGSGLTVVAAAGNRNADACNYSPSFVPEAITVGATDMADNRWQDATNPNKGSNYGTCVDLFAPGVDIPSARIDGQTMPPTDTGTSFAAPHVTGVAAMILTAHPDYSPSEVEDAILAAATPNVVQNAGTGSPNLLLFVEQPPTHAPTNLTAVSNPDGTVGLSWDAVPEPNVHYLVSQRDITAGETVLKRWNQKIISGTTATAKNLFEGHTYEFTVAAANGTGIGPDSNVASAVSRTQPPPAPQNLTATANPSDGTITLDWVAPGPDLWYLVYQRDVTAQETGFTQLPLPITTCCTMAAGYLLHNHDYEFKVTATNRGGEGPPSNLAQARSQYPVPAPPGWLTASEGDGQVALEWTASPTPNVWYLVYERNVSALEEEFTQLPLPITTCCAMTAGFLQNGQTYEFKVTTIGQGGESGPSNVVQATPQEPLPGQVTALTAVANPDGTITLSWAPPPDEAVLYWVQQRNVTAHELLFTTLPLPITATTMTAGLLLQDNEYEFKVYATNQRGRGPDSNLARAVAHYNPPPAPTNLRGVTAGNGMVDLTWDAPGPGGFYYWLYWRDVTAGQTTFTKGEWPTDKTSHSIGPLVHGNLYEFKVSADNQGGEGPQSTPIQVRSLGGLPQPPSNLTATPGDGQVTLQWTASPTPNVLYHIYQRLTPGGSWVKLPLPITGTTMTAGFLTNGQTYEFKVTASNASGNSAASNVASARPMPPLPQPPSNLTATPGDGRVTLRWTASPTPNVYYWIELRTSGDWQRLPYPLSTCCTFDVSLLANGTTYQFRMLANNLAGTSAPSNVATARPMPPLPQPPTNLTATPGDGRVTLRWTASPTSSVWYLIEMRVQGEVNWSQLPYPVTTCCTVDVSLLWNGATYEFRLRSTNLAGKSAPSNVATARPMPPFPQRPINLQVTVLGGSAVRLTWGPSSTQNVLYQVYQRLTPSGSWVPLPLPVDGTWVIAAFLSMGRVYEFKVTAVNLSGESAPSNIVSVLVAISYTVADVQCRWYEVHFVGWTEVRSQAWGVSIAAGVPLRIHRRTYRNDQLWDERPIDLIYTSGSGAWHTDNPMKRATLGPPPSKFDLYVSVEGPNGEIWGEDHDQCWGL